MFIVVESGGDWDEKWSSVNVCSTDRSKLEAYIVEQKDRRQKKKEFNEKRLALYNKIVEENPKREPTLKRTQKPAWPPGLGQNQITQAMRDERAAWKAHDDAFLKELTDINDEWINNVWFPAYRALLVEEGHQVPEVLNFSQTLGSYMEDVDYEIEEIKEL